MSSAQPVADARVGGEIIEHFHDFGVEAFTTGRRAGSFDAKAFKGCDPAFIAAGLERLQIADSRGKHCGAPDSEGAESANGPASKRPAAH